MASEVVMGRPLKISWQDDETALFQRYRAEKQPDRKPRLHALWLLRHTPSPRRPGSWESITPACSTGWPGTAEEG